MNIIWYTYMILAEIQECMKNFRHGEVKHDFERLYEFMNEGAFQHHQGCRHPPLLDGVSKSESSRMVEYYEGLLMAVDSLKRTGTSIDSVSYTHLNFTPQTV